jgi:hypothetical protein
VLNRQVKPRDHYEPKQALHEYNADAEQAGNVDATKERGPNLPQSELASDAPLDQRIEQRLLLGRMMRTGEWEKSYALKHGLGVDLESRPSTVSLQWQLDHAVNPTDAAVLERQLADQKVAQRKWDEDVASRFTPEANAKQQTTTSRAANDTRGTPTTPGLPDYKAHAAEAQRLFDSHGLKVTTEESHDLITKLANDDGKLTVPYILADRLMKHNPPVDSNILEKLSDASRHALFIIPYAHMKNILDMQAMGPGGMEAAANGLKIFAEKHPQHAAALRPLMAAYEMGVMAPSFHVLSTAAEKQEPANLFRYQNDRDFVEQSPRGGVFMNKEHDPYSYNNATAKGVGGPNLITGIDRHENVLDVQDSFAGGVLRTLGHQNLEHSQALYRLLFDGDTPESRALAAKVLGEIGLSKQEIRKTLLFAIKKGQEAKEGGSSVKEFGSVIADRYAAEYAKKGGHDAVNVTRQSPDFDSPAMEHEFVSLDPSKIEPIKWKSWEENIARLGRMGAISPFTGKAFSRIEEASNKILVHWDHAQRMGLDMFLMQHDPAYRAMGELDRGAIINKYLFDYYHQSNMAQWLRRAGAPFPHWRIGSVMRVGSQIGEDPRRLQKMMRAENAIINEFFPDKDDNQSTRPNLNMPHDEFNHALTDPGGYALGTAGPTGDMIRLLIDGAGHFNPHDLVAESGDIAQRAFGTYVPGARMGAEALSGVGQAIGADKEKSPGAALDTLGEYMGSNLFHSKASPFANLGLSLIGGHMQNYPSWFHKLVEAERTRDPNESEWRAEHNVTQRLKKRHR